MKTTAIAITKREVAELVELQVPDAPTADGVLARTLYTLMSPGTELAAFYLREPQPGKPHYPGYAATAVVEQVGAAVTTLRPGDRVFCMGGHRGMQALPAADCVPLPQGLAPELAVLARLMGVSMTTLVTTRARPGERVLITGAGPVGFLAAQLFGIGGYVVAVVEPDAARRAHLAALGLPAHATAAAALAAGEGGAYALAVDCSGHEQAVLEACELLRRGGELVLVGVPWRQRTDLSAHHLLHRVFHRYIHLRSGWEWELPTHPTPQQPQSIFGNFRTALEWLASGRIAVDGLLDRRAPAAAQAAYQDHLQARSPGLFTVFHWSD